MQLVPSKVKASTSMALDPLRVTAPEPPPPTFHAEQEPPVPSVSVAAVEAALMILSV